MSFAKESNCKEYVSFLDLPSYPGTFNRFKARFKGVPFEIALDNVLCKDILMSLVAKFGRFDAIYFYAFVFNICIFHKNLWNQI